MKIIIYFSLYTMLFVLLTGCNSSKEDEKTYLVTDVTTLTFENGGGSLYLSIESNSSWTITPTEEWIGITNKQGSGNQQIMVSVADLLNPIMLEGVLSIRTNDGAKTVNVKVQVKGGIPNYPAENDRVLTLTNASNNMNFDGSAHDADSLCFMSNIAWEVKGPEWLEAWDGTRWRPLSQDHSVVYGTGSQNLSIRTVSSYDGEALLEDEITICERLTGNYMRKMKIFRTGKFSVLTNKFVVLVDGLAFNFKCGSSVSTIYYHVTDKTLNLATVTANEMRNNWKKAVVGGAAGVDNLKANTMYYIYLISEASLNTSNPQSFVLSCYTAKNQDQPEATVKQIVKTDNYWFADVTMSDNAFAYIVLGAKDGDYWVKFNNPLIAFYMSTLSLLDPDLFNLWSTSGFVPILQDVANISEVHCATWAMGNDGRPSGVLHHYVRRLKSSAPAIYASQGQSTLFEFATKEDFERFSSEIKIIR